MSQQFCLKWNNHMNNMMDVFKNLLNTESMVDVTLACDGLSLKAHKMVLSACSPFFQSLFLENPCKHPIVILKDMKYTELKAIIEFMYHGEVNVAQEQLSALMKTAETLRVKGLAEMPNEKNSSSSAQEEPSHRSVPRTETPPPSKRRRGRVRKRSLSDSNRSDDSNDPKIKQPHSPDIEELSGDVTMDNTSGQFSNLQSQVPMQSLPSHSNSYQKSSSVVTQDPQIEEPASADESEFGVEPAKLLEQTLTTDDLQNRRSRTAMSSSMDMQRRPRSSTDHSSNLVPTSMSSDTSLSANQQPESPPDIKPELLELDPPMSPVAGPSHSTDNSMMMYMDQSSVSSHPGTSFQDNTALVPQDSQPQVCIMAILHNGKKAFRCNICEYTCTRLSWAKIHTRVHTGDKPFECEFCGQRFTWYNTYKKHLKLCDAVKGDLVPLSSVGKKVKDDSVPLLSVGKKVMDDVVPPSLVGKKVKDDMVTPSLVSKKVKDDSVPPSSAGKKMKDDMVSTSLVGKKVKYDKAPSSSDDKKTQLKKIFKCNICGKEFLEEEACRWHLSFCSENLKTQKVLETFLNPEAPWQCSFCGKNFDDDQLYLSHSASCNQDIKEQKDSEMMIPFVETEVLKCEFCGKRCENIGVWTKHTAHCSSKSKTIQIVEDILELNEKRSECYFCHEKFANETDCRNHLASCSQISPEENWPYKCELCDKGFIYRGRLTRHLNFCSERFKTQQIVEEILKSNEKTFECHFCKKKFENETNYMNHSISCDNNPETQLAVQELLKLGLSE